MLFFGEPAFKSLLLCFRLRDFSALRSEFLLHFFFLLFLCCKTILLKLVSHESVLLKLSLLLLVLGFELLLYHSQLFLVLRLDYFKTFVFMLEQILLLKEPCHLGVTRLTVFVLPVFKRFELRLQSVTLFFNI